MKTLVINGSPRTNGDTAALLAALKKQLVGEVVTLSAYQNDIAPCNDCRQCWQNKGCVIQDDMSYVYADDFDTVVIASPVYMATLPGPLVSLASRFQAYYAAKRFLGDAFCLKEKTAVLILAGGGSGYPEQALLLAKWMFGKMNAQLDQENMVFSLHTDEVPAAKDDQALKKISEIAKRLNQRSLA